jgi:hypothetical protein
MLLLLSTKYFSENIKVNTYF